MDFWIHDGFLDSRWDGGGVAWIKMYGCKNDGFKMDFWIHDGFLGFYPFGITGQGFQGVGLKLKVFINVFRDLAFH